ncbi:hypothetical protein AVEN_114519-1 [Araneus ventricosus]|uniref:Uncharacterized protein n=1 Tax=Araneus ventricosus TaxID=182803 RepID=A0A4Y2S5N6_ARAVE|nr:hypothetical protein AVEN_266555-1 [Araneus ventricosus]GBN83203.1 hypothetical protein AVEN_114519-1 [Araneus ventricosus]
MSLPIEPVIIFTFLSEDNLVPDKCLEPRLGSKSGLYGGLWLQTSKLQLELLNQFLSFASGMGVAMQENDTLTQHARAFAPDGLTMAK